MAYEDEIVAAMPGPTEAAILALPAGTPVLTYIRTGFTTDRAVRVSISTFAADRNRIVYTLGNGDVITKFRASEDQ